MGSGWRRDGVMGQQATTGPTLTPPGQDLRTGLAAITGTRQLLGAWARRPPLGRAVGHWRQLQGLGTLVLREPRGLWALLPLHGLGGLGGPKGWDRGSRVSGCTVQGAGGGACPSEGGLEVPDADQGLAGG